VVAGTAGRTLSSYAGINPGEFFAVATEVFFDDPRGLQREHADLYAVLSEFYRQDPSSRIV
jgi:Mlc titration factor MtfA (ptsG expression regulator)